MLAMMKISKPFSGVVTSFCSISGFEVGKLLKISRITKEKWFIESNFHTGFCTAEKHKKTTENVLIKKKI